MSSQLPYQLPSSHTSATTSTRSRRRSSTDKLGFVQRTSSTSSLHRITSNKSNSSTGATSKGHKHHVHVAHTSASKHHRTTSLGHRVPSYGKGLNKLTALTNVNTDNVSKEYLSIHSIVNKAEGTMMQRSHSEGSSLAKKQRRQSSSSSLHSSRQRIRRLDTTPHDHPSTTKRNVTKQPVQFSTRHSSDEEDDDGTMVHRKSSEIVDSPQPYLGIPHQFHPVSLAPPSTIHLPPAKSALKEGLSSSAPKFLQKSLSSATLVPPKVCITNAHSKDLARPSTSAEQQAYTDGIQSPTPTSEPQISPSSNPISHFILSTPPSRNPRTPDLDGLRSNQSSTSLATMAQDHPIPLTTALQGKLTRTQQKLLLQRASTQSPIHSLTGTPSGYTSSPSLQQTARMETNAPDYFSLLPSTAQTTLTPGVPTNIPYDVKVVREFDRISRELANAKRFGDPTADAIARLQHRVAPTRIGSATPKQRLTKKQSGFGLSMSWKRSPDTPDSRTGGNIAEDDVFAGEKSSKVREVMRRLWLDEGDVADIMGLGRAGDDDADEAMVSGSKFRLSSARL